MTELKHCYIFTILSGTLTSRYDRGPVKFTKCRKENVNPTIKIEIGVSENQTKIQLASGFADSAAGGQSP